MILSSEVSEKDIEPMLAFYKNHYQVVDVVKCEMCKAFLAFELAGGDGMGMQPNEIGKYIVPIGNKLVASRVRLDEAPTGERMMGYQCLCGNDSRLAAVERGSVPTGKMQTSLSPFEKFEIAERIRANKKHKPDFKKRGAKKFFEKFSVERIQ